jgi:nucleoside-diphosphate-sugar epimerase
VNDALPHSYSYTPDAAASLIQLAERTNTWNQTWHVPTAPAPPTGKDFVELTAHAFGVAPKYRVLRRSLLRLAGWFNSQIGELYEMLYQNDSPYLFDSSKFTKEFGFPGTPYATGIRDTAASFKGDSRTRR